MISNLFHTVFYDPIYNALIALVALVPGGDVGVAVIVVTIGIRLILLPFSLATARTQQAMKTLEPKLKEIKEKYKNDKEKQALETLALYKEGKINPFATILTTLIQLPVLFALYWVFFQEPLPTINTEQLYGFTPTPSAISLEFLGLVSVTSKSLFLSFLAGLTLFFQSHTSLKGTMKPPETPGFQKDFQKVMGMQLKYVFPLIIAVVSYSTSTAIALYFITTNIAGILQEWYVRRALRSGELQRVAP